MADSQTSGLCLKLLVGYCRGQKHLSRSSDVRKAIGTSFDFVKGINSKEQVRQTHSTGDYLNFGFRKRC